MVKTTRYFVAMLHIHWKSKRNVLTIIDLGQCDTHPLHEPYIKIKTQTGLVTVLKAQHTELLSSFPDRVVGQIIGGCRVIKWNAWSWTVWESTWRVTRSLHGFDFEKNVDAFKPLQ